VEIGAGGTLLAHQAAGVAVTILALSAEPDVAVAIDRLIAQAQPTVLYTHSVNDSQLDHRNAHTAVVAAARRIGSVFCFQSPSATFDFRPAHFVAIDDYIAGKLSALRSFAAQPEVRDYLEPDQVTSTARYWSRYCEAQHAEAFEVVRDRSAAAGMAAGAQGQAPAAS
jgi:LmbE family N-acetylglucosaminyl deacetylase